jgi:cytochrome c-type biogenesis protein
MSLTIYIVSAVSVFFFSGLLAYGIGYCTVLVLAGTFTEVVEHYLHWSEKSKGEVILKKACGILVILGGGYLINLNFI